MLTLGMMLTGFARLVAADDATDFSKVVPEVLGKKRRREATGMIERDIRRTAEINARNREEWGEDQDAQAVGEVPQLKNRGNKYSNIHIT